MSVYDDARDALSDMIQLEADLRLAFRRLDREEAAEDRGRVYGRSNTDYSPPAARHAPVDELNEEELAVVTHDPVASIVAGATTALRSMRRARADAICEQACAAAHITNALGLAGDPVTVKAEQLILGADRLRARLGRRDLDVQLWALWWWYWSPARGIMTECSKARRALCSAIGTIERVLAPPKKPDGAKPMAVDSPKWCRSCIRVGVHTPRADAKHRSVKDPLCGWCAGVKRDYGVWPTIPAVELHAQRARISQRQMDEAMGRKPKREAQAS